MTLIWRHIALNCVDFANGDNCEVMQHTYVDFYMVKTVQLNKILDLNVPLLIHSKGKLNFLNLK